ncbi:MAG: ferritin [Elusimicrobiaceae bacterium]|nr:ferritin [Elusimicrobiaceae bacterium]
MGMIGRKIVEKAGLDVKELIHLLNQAFSDEWLAYYQYWAGAQIASGLMAPVLRPELEEHAAEELDHAKKLAKRIIELGGTPVLSPEEWYKQSTCGYLIPKDSNAATLLKQNLQGERCAIEVYNKLLKYVLNKDMITSHIVRQILQEEIEHEQELEDLGNDYEIVLPNLSACNCKKK